LCYFVIQLAIQTQLLEDIQQSLNNNNSNYNYNQQSSNTR
jgi:hypothetical protein